MVDQKIESDFGVRLRGQVSLYKVPGHIPEHLASQYLNDPVFEGKNLVVTGAQVALARMLRGETNDYVPSYISIGGGGDFDQDTKLDTGGRVSPALADTSMRQVSYRIPIVATEDGATENSWCYVAVARPHEAITPLINEFGLESRNGTLLAHFVTEAETDGRAKQYCKTSVEYLVVRWCFTIGLVVNASIQAGTQASGVWLRSSDLNDVTSLTIPALPLVTAGTEIAVAVLNDNGTDFGSIDVQTGNIINVTLQDGTIASLFLEEIFI